MSEANNMPIFQIDEDDLVDAIFHGTALNARGSGTMAEAREQARIMLAALTAK